MIHDKDFMMRIVRQFSNLLSKLILGKNEGEFIEDADYYFDTQLNDIFKENFTQFSSKAKGEIINVINKREDKDHKDYYEMLGNLFYLKGKETNNKDFLDKAKTFYELYLQTSGIFALPVINRISELNQI